MNKRHILTLALSFTLMLLSAVPAFAGTWEAQADDTWVYINDDGESVTGWIEDGEHIYYLKEDGTKKTGWYKSKGSWYYFNEDGTLTCDTWIDNYYVNSKGKWVKTR